MVYVFKSENMNSVKNLMREEKEFTQYLNKHQPQPWREEAMRPMPLRICVCVCVCVLILGNTLKIMNKERHYCGDWLLN